jgi:hypothetical protein
MALYVQQISCPEQFVTNLKGPWHKIFNLCFLSSNNFPWVIDKQVKFFSNMASNSQRLSTTLVAQQCDITAVSLCHWHRCATKFFSNILINHLTHCFCKEIWLGCTRCDFGPHIKEALTIFKENIYQKTYIGKLSCTIPITFTHKIWGLTRDHFLS